MARGPCSFNRDGLDSRSIQGRYRNTIPGAAARRPIGNLCRQPSGWLRIGLGTGRMYWQSPLPLLPLLRHQHGEDTPPIRSL